ncbi:hypothetical protein [Sodalis-like endosymbiont of Proechinophthirus fluctus]|uniref:hypothetical protein n=1 Tax=Sodalis-like endosymbiont of Proechinophthirus fluctus TaxID=1462730 RepID=UPI001FCC8A7F|nr:hypothetical protein [Sodalis-like endosymbiont of Proechinophthirus fluctus]
MVYAYSKNFTLSLSNDEVVRGKESILGRMHGDDWQKFTDSRAYYDFIWAHPGNKNLLFLCNEFTPRSEWNHKKWNHDIGLDWHLLENERCYHAGVQRLMRNLDQCYRSHPHSYTSAIIRFPAFSS